MTDTPTLTNYTAIIEVDTKEPLERIDLKTAMAKLMPFDGVIGQQHITQCWSATVTVKGENLAQATATAIALVEDAYDCQSRSCKVLQFDEYMVRSGYPLGL